MTLTATLSSAASQDVTVGISTSGTATEGSDYQRISDITISAGQTTGTASFTPTNDNAVEGSEQAVVEIASVSGGGASEQGSQSVSITITDDDNGVNSKPSFSLSVPDMYPSQGLSLIHI